MQLTPPTTNEKNGHGQDVYNQLKTLVAANRFSVHCIMVINDIRMLFFLGKRVSANIKSISNETMSDSVFDGANVHIIDSHKYYDKWKNMLDIHVVNGGSREGKSSHQSDSPQFEIALPQFGCVLFGTRNHGTWFQTENHAFTTGLYDQAAHAGDYIMHKSTGGKQVGPTGYSSFTEKTGNELFIGMDVAKAHLKLD